MDKGLETKLRKVKQHKHVDEEEKDIVQEILNDSNEF